MQRFLDLADFERAEVKDLLGLAARLQVNPDPHALAGKVLGLLFMNPSLRTLASFQSGMMRLGGSAFVITPGQGTWQLETRNGAVMNGAAAEHIKEAVPVMASYCDALGVRMFAEGKNLQADVNETGFKMIADLCEKPLINLESAVNHPCQALADWYTMDELNVPERGKFVLSWVNHPRALPLAVPQPPCRWRPCVWMSWCCVPMVTPCRTIMDRHALLRKHRAAISPKPPIAPKLERRAVVCRMGLTLHYGNAEAETPARRSNRLVCEGQLVQAHRTGLSPDALPACAAQCGRG
jgi:hypothetical protein